MSTAPSILLLDDGELDRVTGLLQRMGVDFVHKRGHDICNKEELPRDLLITSLDRALSLPELTSEGDTPANPVRVCVHKQDFLPLRERLRGLGVHYLVHSLVDPETLRLLFVQLLFHGDEQRGALRLPLGCQVSYRDAAEQSKAMLCELTRESCRIVTTHDVPSDTPVHLELPRELAGTQAVELSGVAIRSTACQLGPDGGGFQVVVQFAELEHESRSFLESLFGGRRLGTRVTPLEPTPERSAESIALLATPDPEESYDEIVLDRRGDARRRYGRRIAALTARSSDAPQVVLGRDLSGSGICIARNGSLSVGMHIALAIYGSDGEEPLVVEADIVRDAGEEGLGLRFQSLDTDQRDRLDAILSELPALEELGAEAREQGEGDRVWVSKVLS